MSNTWDEIFEDPKSPVAEEFDQSWPFNFKWAYDSQTGRTDVWKVMGGKDGAPTHRKEVEDRWGRSPRVSEGDVLGLATYIPAETKLDGTVVAPADIQIHPYYGQSAPPQIKQWFEDQFPQAIVRSIPFPSRELPKKTADVGEGWHAEDGWKDSDFELPSVDDSGSAPVYKWLWNKHDGLIVWETDDENGLPTHSQKCKMEWGRDTSVGEKGDKLGYAFIDYPDEGVITMESFDAEAIPHAAFEDVKKQLLEWFPHSQIITDDGPPEKHEFNSDPADYKTAAVAWAQEHLGGAVSPPAATPAKTGLLGRLLPKWRRKKLAGDSGIWKCPVCGEPEVYLSPTPVLDPEYGNYRCNGCGRRFHRQDLPDELRLASRKTADADMDGAMVALFVPEEAAKKLQVKGGEPTEQMHITLLYFTDKAADRDDWDEVKKIIEQIANQTPPLSGKVSGYGVFNAPDGDVLWAAPSVQGLAELRHKVFEACEDAGFHVSTEHDWTPHVTLKYNHKGKLPDNEEIKLDFPELSFAQGGDHHDFSLTGKLEKTAMAERMGQPGEKMYHYRSHGWSDFVQEKGLPPTDPNPLDQNNFPGNPEAVYLFSLHPDSPEMQDMGSSFDPSKGELYEVDVEGLPLDPDQWLPNAWYYKGGYISPDRIRKIGSLEKTAADYTIDTGKGEVNGEHYTHRTPYIYIPNHDKVFWGIPGQYHGGLAEWVKTQGHNPWVEPSVFGSVYTHPDTGARFQEIHSDGYRGEWGESRRKEILEKRLGIPFGVSDEPELTNSDIEQYWDDHFGHTASDDYLDWSGWEGAHRFVTDGKEILTDPESGGIDPSNWKGTDELRQKFLSFHPDAKSPVVGWTVPTADKMGIGIWAPAAGHGDKHEPGLHEIIQIVEKTLGKPAHIITNDTHLSDDKMYDPGIVSEWQQI